MKKNEKVEVHFNKASGTKWEYETIIVAEKVVDALDTFGAKSFEYSIDDYPKDKRDDIYEVSIWSTNIGYCSKV